MKKNAFKFLFFLLLLSSLTSLFAIDANSDVTIVKVPIIDYPNFLKIDDNNFISGYAYEYLKEIQKYTNWQYEFIRMSFSEASYKLASGEIDLVPGNQYTKERADLWDYSNNSMGEGGTVLCSLISNQKYAYNDLDSYSGMKIGCLKGSARIKQTEEKLIENGAKVTFIEYLTDLDSKVALKNGEIDAILMSSIRCEKDYKIIARLQNTPLFFCTNKKRPELKKEVDKAMELIHLESPYYEEELDKKFYGNIIIQTTLSEEEKEYVKNSKTIIVSTSKDMIPVEYYNEKHNQFEGITINMLKMISERTGLNFKFIPRGNTESLNKQLEKNEVQLVSSVVCLSDFENDIQVNETKPFYSNSIILVVRSKDDIGKDYDDLMIVKEGYPLYDNVAKSHKYNNIVYANSFDSCLNAVAKGKAKFTLLHSNGTSFFGYNNRYSNLTFYPFPDGDFKFGFGVSKYTDPILLSIMNKTIASISNEDRTQLLIESILAASDTKTFKDFILENERELLFIIISAIAIILLIFHFNSLKIVKLNQKLSKEIKRADESSAAKSMFLSRMSHDLRTPMNAIIGFSEIGTESKDEKEKSECLEKINFSGKYLLSIINDVLDMSKIAEGKIIFNPEPYAYSEFEKIVKTLIIPKAKEKNINFVIKVEVNTEIPVSLDKAHFQQVFVNLLNNAIKFTPSGKNILFHIFADEITSDNRLPLTFIIKDEGVGMSEEFLKKKIFQPFEQERNSETQAGTGTGLGLAISKRLIEQMGGSIKCESKLGVGTTFTVKFSPVICKEYNSVATSRQTSYDNLVGKKVLLCEDNPLNSQIAVNLLEKKGIKVTVAESGENCLKEFENSSIKFFDEILMDIQLPGINGLEATELIRKLNREDSKQIPIIAMSANAFDDDIKKSLDAGMNAHVRKPIDPTTLFDTLVKFIL